MEKVSHQLHLPPLANVHTGSSGFSVPFVFQLGARIDGQTDRPVLVLQCISKAAENFILWPRDAQVS